MFIETQWLIHTRSAPARESGAVRVGRRELEDGTYITTTLIIRYYDTTDLAFDEGQ